VIPLSDVDRRRTLSFGFHTTLLHQGMVVVGLHYSFEGQSRTDEVGGGSPYGASTIAGSDGKRQPTEIDLDGARYLGKHVAEIGKKLMR
jgi:NAD(P)H dehydrogenase (quinone)